MSNEIFACRIKWKITQPCWVWYRLVLFSVKLFLFCHPQLAGYNDEVLDVKFLGPGDSHIVVATNSPQLKVFELSTSHCQILYGHTGVCVCGQLWCGWVKDAKVFLYPTSLTTLMWGLESSGSAWSSITTYFGGLVGFLLAFCGEGIYLCVPDFANAALSLSRSVSSVPLNNWHQFNLELRM